MIHLTRTGPAQRALMAVAAAAGLLAGAANAQELKIGYVNSERVLSEAELNRRQRELVEQDRDLQRKRREFQEDLNQRKNEELAAVVERANRVIKQIFDQEKYDLIVQEVVFAGPRVDITDKVIKALNAAPPSR
jgi:Skp family chaperone for outer membrane proteins